MRELSIDEMEYVAGGRGLPRQYDSCNDPDGSEIYAVWAQEEAYLDSLKQSQIISFYLAYDKAPSAAVAAKQLQFCLTDSLFSEMMKSRDFPGVVRTLVADTNASGWEHASNYYGNGLFSWDPYTSRDSRTVHVSELSLWSVFGGRADVVIHTHPQNPAGGPGLSGSLGDLRLADHYNIGVMAVRILEPGGVEYFCYKPKG